MADTLGAEAPELDGPEPDILGPALDIVIQKSPALESVPILFSQIQPLLEVQAGREAIKDAFPHLQDKPLMRAEGFFYAKTRRGAARGRNLPSLRVLCDENISVRHLRACQDAFGYASNAKFEAICGKPDKEVWQYALDHGFHLIVTQDQRNRDDNDLTRIAAESWRRHMVDSSLPLELLAGLPQVVHLKGEAKDSEKFEDIARDALMDVFAMHARREGPVVVINGDGARLGMRAFDLLVPDARGCKPDKSESELIEARKENWARKYMQAVLPDRNLWQERDDPSVLARKRLVTRAVAIATHGSVTIPVRRRRAMALDVAF